MLIGWSGCLNVFRVVLVEFEIFVVIARAEAAVLQMWNFCGNFYFESHLLKISQFRDIFTFEYSFQNYQDIFKSKKVTLVFVYEFLEIFVRDLG